MRCEVTLAEKPSSSPVHSVMGTAAIADRARRRLLGHFEKVSHTLTSIPRPRDPLGRALGPAYPPEKSGFPCPATRWGRWGRSARLAATRTLSIRNARIIVSDDLIAMKGLHKCSKLYLGYFVEMVILPLCSHSIHSNRVAWTISFISGVPILPTHGHSITLRCCSGKLPY